MDVMDGVLGLMQCRMNGMHGFFHLPGLWPCRLSLSLFMGNTNRWMDECGSVHAESMD